MATKKAAKKAPAKKAAVKKAATVAAKPAAAAAPVVAAATPTIFDHLTKATKVTPSAGEEYQAFAVRLMEAVGALPDAEFAALPEPAQTWFNGQAENYSGNKDIGALPGYPLKKAAKKTAAAKPAKEAKAAKAPKKDKPVRDPAKIRAESTAGRIHALVVAKPDIEFTAVAKKLGIDDKAGSYAWNRYNEARNLMALVQQRAA
jgi:hypothetical protein